MNILPEKNTPRWLIFLIDIFLCLFALLLAYLVRFDFLSLPYEEELPVLKGALPFYIGIRAISFWISKTYAGIIRHTSTYDAKRIFVTITAGSLVFLGLSPIRKEFIDGYNFLPLTIILVDYLACVFILISSRIAVKLIYLESKKDRSEIMNVVIYGAGQAGLITKRTLDREANRKQKVVAFFDDDSSKAGKSIEGAQIIHTSKLSDFLQMGKAEQLIISIQNPDAERKNDVLDTCIKYGVEALNVPPVSTWINGELNVKQLRKVKIEDLLGRKPIRINQEKLEADISGKVILVTGAAGSIGSGIVQQIVRFKPQRVYLLDQAESPLYEIEQSLIQAGYGELIVPIIADITNRDRIDQFLAAAKVDIVYHAAAYKHVPLMELNVPEAILTNISGTKNLVELSVSHQVERFIMISTDKAVNPTSVMGASKRVAEIFAQTQNSKTKFITTRFGNVLGSNGSVIPLFKKQIEAGGPVTLTHPEVTRYFMTIPEACQLVLEAGAMGEGGEIFIFDMGESVKIMDLAEKMIKLSGMKPHEEIEIKITGLRPGEKLYEELLANEENTLATHHPQILRAQVREYESENVKNKIQSIIEAGNQNDSNLAVSLIKDLVPEYISNNSEFAKFDTQIK